MDPMRSDDFETPTNNNVNLEQLPPDLMRKILSFLFLHDFDSLNLASRRLREAVSCSDHVFMNERSMCLSHNQEAHMTEAGMRALLQRFESINVLHLHGLAAVGDKLFSILNESPSAQTLQRVSLHGCCLSYWCPTSLQLQNLTHLSIMGGSIRVALGSFITASLRLKSLAIGQCSSLRDEDVRDITHRLKRSLESLCLHQCRRVKKPLLQFENLTALNLMGCFTLSDLPLFDCPMLKSVCFSFCFQLDGTLIQRVVDSLDHLEHLTLVKCPRLEHLNITSATLRTINVSLSNGIQTLRLSCPQLYTLDTTSCASLKYFFLNSQSIQELQFTMLPVFSNAQIISSSLRRLFLGGCQGLIEAQIDCPNLTHVDICGTPLSSDVFLRTATSAMTKALDPHCCCCCYSPLILKTES